MFFSKSLNQFFKLIRNHLIRTFCSETPLTKIIQNSIRKEGPISVKLYMEIALHHPEYGYYTYGNPLGKKGDFGTFPEISQLFGEMVGSWCAQAWERLGKPSDFILLELGPGQGTMMKYALRITSAHENFLENSRLYLVESSSTLRDIQNNKLKNYAPSFMKVEDLEHLPSLPIIWVANEFFDTLPIQQFVMTSTGWHERLIDVEQGYFSFVLSDESRDFCIPETVPTDKQWPVDSIYEYSPQSHQITQMLSSHIRRHRGAGLIVDYGYMDVPLKGSLDAWSKQEYVGIFTTPGQADITADVDFEALRRTAEQAGITVDGPVWQGDFLVEMGINQRADNLKRSASATMIKDIDDEIHCLMDRKGLGQNFKVMMVRSWASL